MYGVGRVLSTVAVRERDEALGVPNWNRNGIM